VAIALGAPAFANEGIALKLKNHKFTPAEIRVRANVPNLIVMTSHGQGGLGRMIFGSVAESVLRGTRTPILIVRDVGAPVSPPLGATTTGSARGASAA
jgi:nucleotide-binding universal stress UspA family protein